MRYAWLLLALLGCGKDALAPLPPPHENEQWLGTWSTDTVHFIGILYEYYQTVHTVFFDCKTVFTLQLVDDATTPTTDPPIPYDSDGNSIHGTYTRTPMVCLTYTTDYNNQTDSVSVYPITWDFLAEGRVRGRMLNGRDLHLYFDYVPGTAAGTLAYSAEVDGTLVYMRDSNTGGVRWQAREGRIFTYACNVACDLTDAYFGPNLLSGR